MDSPTLVMLCGPSFSGKSTCAKRLAEHHGALVVSLDKIMRSRGWEPGEGAPDGEWYAAHVEAKRVLGSAMASGAGLLVLDDTNCFRFLRDAFRELAGAHAYRTILVLLRPSAEELQLRRRRNDLDPSRKSIRDEVFHGHLASFEWPSSDEDPVDEVSVLETLAGWHRDFGERRQD
jgi:predicted kinase